MRRTLTERRAHFGRQGLSRCRAGQPTGSASGTSCSSLALKQPLLYKAPGPNPGCKEISPAALKLTCNTSSVPVIWETDQHRSQGCELIVRRAIASSESGAIVISSHLASFLGDGARKLQIYLCDWVAAGSCWVRLGRE